MAVGAEVARSDIANLFQFAAILNINLAVINILPLPVRHPLHISMLLIRSLVNCCDVGCTGSPEGVARGIMAGGIRLPDHVICITQAEKSLSSTGL